MLSMPPATTMAASPSARMSCASITLFMPDPQTLLTVVAGTLSGRPPAIPAWRAGAWPSPADSTQPISSSEASPGGTPQAASAARIAIPPSSGAASPRSPPWNAPIGVRRAATTTTGSGIMRPAANQPWNSSRPISMRRISLVPAPISYSLASRSSRPVGMSLT